ncbi:MAG: hypothetical protein WA705_31415 [Candidatus Ozemobacteraceae bacterium]
MKYHTGMAMITFLTLWLCLHAETSWCAEDASTSNAASASVTLLYEAGGTRNSILLRTAGNQRMFLSKVNGMECLAQARDSGEKNTDWNCDILDQHWCNALADGLLVVDYIASEADLRWLVVDSGFHAFYGFNDPPFWAERNSDLTFGQVAYKSFVLGNDVRQSFFRLRKVLFANRLPFHADFKLCPDKKSFVGIRRIVLRLFPVEKQKKTEIPKGMGTPGTPEAATPISLRNLLNAFYRNLLDRLPEAWEIRRWEQSYQKQEISTFFLLRNILQSSEYQDKCYSPLRKKDAIKALYVRACGRNPSAYEMNWFYSYSSSANLTFGMRVFVEKYYAEIVEHAIDFLRSNPE